jgi:hypothetical protein
LDDLDKNERKGMMNVPLEDGRLLRLLTESIGAKRVVEIGTSNGYSGIWFCLALRKTGGHLVTHGEETLIRTKVESQAMTRITEFYPENKHGYGTRRECGKGPVGVPCRAADV